PGFARAAPRPPARTPVGPGSGRSALRLPPRIYNGTGLFLYSGASADAGWDLNGGRERAIAPAAVPSPVPPAFPRRGLGHRDVPRAPGLLRPVRRLPHPVPPA